MSWSARRLDQLGHVSRGRSRHRPRDAAHLYDGPYPFIQTGDVKHAGLYLTEYQQSYSEAGLEQSKLWPAGTLCITIAANIADTAILGIDACFPDSVIDFIAHPNEADARFVKYLFDATVQWRVQQFTQGAAQDNLSQGKLLSIEFQIPPVDKQTRIADILSAYDDLIENNLRRMALLEEAARQLYREWFVRLRFPGHEHTLIINGVPEGWEKTNALEGMSVLSGGTPKTTVADYWDGEIPFYTPKDASDQCYVLETERSITELGLKNCNSRLYSTDTVFISARGTVGKLNLAYQPMAMSQSCYALIGKSHVSQFFLYCALQESIEYLKQHAVGAVFDAIVVDTFKLIPFMVPDGKNVRLFDGSVAPMFRQVGNLLEQNQKLHAARDLLLPRLMSGKIAV
jgi:type I restriction enzyme, S subunit